MPVEAPQQPAHDVARHDPHLEAELALHILGEAALYVARLQLRLARQRLGGAFEVGEVVALRLEEIMQWRAR
jgi:hypothetical protein